MLIEASRTLAETVRMAVKGKTVSRGKTPGTAGALMMPNGDITTHSSMTPDKGTQPATRPAVHPLAQAALDRTLAALGDTTGAGHGKCAEVALVSDQLYRLEQQWREAGEPGALEQYALDALRGAKIVTHQIKPALVEGIPYDLGHYRPPCRSCAHVLPQFAIEPIADPERSPANYQPSVPGAVGNGRPLSDARPYGDPQGLVPPAPADQQALEDAVPRDPDTGRPEVHPDPRVGNWADLVNDGGPTVPGRDRNCADGGVSFLSTWFGRPEVAAATADTASVERNSTARQEQALRTPFSHRGTGADGLADLAAALREAGHGTAALIITTFTAANTGATGTVNHNGTIVWSPLRTERYPTRARSTAPVRQVCPSQSMQGDQSPAVTRTGTDAPATGPDPVPPHSLPGRHNPATNAGEPAVAQDQTNATESDYLSELSDADQRTLLDAVAAAQQDADRILADIQRIAADANTKLGLTGADTLQTLGEKNRVKAAESLARKFSTELAPMGYGLDTALQTVNDIVRFSVRGPESEAYGPAVDQLLSTLEANRYQVTDLKSFWHPGNRFFGLNCTLVSPNGRTFELQFPTATSYTIGNQTHVPYEVMRDPASPVAAQVHAYLDILVINKANGAAASMPGGMDSRPERFSTPKDTSFSAWAAKPAQADLLQEYAAELAAQAVHFRKSSPTG